MMEALQQTCVGAFAGAVEVSCMQPTIAIKNALQVGVGLSAAEVDLRSSPTCIPRLGT